MANKLYSYKQTFTAIGGDRKTSHLMVQLEGVAIDRIAEHLGDRADLFPGIEDGGVVKIVWVDALDGTPGKITATVTPLKEESNEGQ